MLGGAYIFLISVARDAIFASHNEVTAPIVVS